jgi:hypothetical protein
LTKPSVDISQENKKWTVESAVQPSAMRHGNLPFAAKGPPQHHHIQAPRSVMLDDARRSETLEG